MSDNRDGFGSKLGAIAAAAGSAIGLGNIYRFPCLAGENGGGAFLLIYVLIVLGLGIPIMMAEFYIGRRGGKNPVGSIKVLSPKTKWNWIGYIGILAAFVVLAFYSTVSGWTLEYIYKAATNFFADKDIATIEQGFVDFNNNPFRPFLWQFIFMGLTAFIIFKGIKEGVEKYTKIMMPALFVILIILCVKSLTLDGAGEGLKFLFKPDFSKVDGNVILAALGQAFFSLSVGMGALITYGSYISKKDNLATTSLSVVAADTIVAILAGIIIFPAAFTFGIQPEAGAGLAFNTLPMIFDKMTGGYFFCIIFFILLAIAALTSTISLLEVVVAFLSEEHGIKRNTAIWIGTLVALFFGVFCTLSLRTDSVFVFGDMTFFDFMDKFSANILLPIGALFIVIFVAWKMGKESFYDEITNQNTLKMSVKKFIFFIIKYVAPIVIVAIFINQLVNS